MRLRSAISGRLLETLLEGRKRLGGGALERVREYVASQRTGGGGFAGPGGEEDIYYTLFGWMLEWTLGMRRDGGAMRAYLEGLDRRGMDLVHYAAWVRCGMLQRLVAAGRFGALAYLFPPRLPEPPQSAARVRGGDPLSPYSLFVRLSLDEDSGRGIADRSVILKSLDDYRAHGGGWANVRGAAEATTNATAAAMMVTGQLKGYRRGADSLFLRELQQVSGGFGAVAGSPIPDLLSTATALFTLGQYGEGAKYPAADFIEAHWLDGGGFAATLSDGAGDVEYTFYGLLALGAL